MSLPERDPTRKTPPRASQRQHRHTTALKHVELYLRSHPRPISEQLLALKIAGYMNGLDRCQVLLSTLATSMDLDERSVRRLLRRLDGGDQPLFSTQHRYKRSSVFTLIRQHELSTVLDDLGGHRCPPRT